MNVLDLVPHPHRTVVLHVFEQRAPELLEALRQKQMPTYAEVERVENVMYDVVAKHYLPGHELDAEGLRTEDALVSFVSTFPNDCLPDAPP